MSAQPTIDETDPPTLTFDAGFLATTWLAVAIASGKDEERPSLSRTVLVEIFPNGVRLVATDGYVLLTGWVPMYADSAPELAEAPGWTAIAIDAFGRGRGLMGHLRKLAADADEEGIEVHATLRVGEAPIDQTSTAEFEGLERQAVMISHPGHEDLALPLFEGEFPRWRGLFHDHKPSKTAAIALNPEILGRLAKLGKLDGSTPLIWRFGGTVGSALIEIGEIRGVVMPVRWAGLEVEGAEE